MIKKIFLPILLLLTLYNLSGCSAKMQKALPALADGELQEELANTSDEFSAGWKDGCETGISGGANTFYKMFYRSNRIDGFRMASSADYRDAYEYAFWYCFRSTYVRQKSSLWSSIMKGFR